MSSVNRRQKNAIKESELPKKRSLSQSTSPRRPPKERFRSENEKPTPSELEEAQLLMEAAGNTINTSPVEQNNEVVLFLPDSSATLDETEASKPEISEEDLKKELQQLLDSQLEAGESEDKHLLRNRDQMNEDASDFQPEVIDKPNRGFSSNEIQAFLNSQIKKQHKQQFIEEQLDMQSDRSHHQQQHLILVTQNGDKIILIQNPADVEGEEGEVTATEYTAPELTEAEEQAILLGHRVRQQILLDYLERLRVQHRERLPPCITTPSVPHMQPIKLVPFPATNAELEPSTVDESASTSTSTFVDVDECSPNKSRPRMKKPLKKREACLPKWIRPIHNHLDSARKFCLRRAEKIDEVSKSFPSASESFESRCSKMKQDFINFEIAINRFQDTVSRELEEANNQFKSFLRDYHLESCLGEIEAADEIDLTLTETEEVESNRKVPKKTVKKSPVGVDKSKM